MVLFERYYVAEGVRLYSQESWRLITHDRGKQLVEKHISETVSAACWLVEHKVYRRPRSSPIVL